LTDTKEALHKVPKSELHIHLLGAVPIEVLTELMNRHPVSETLRSATIGERKLFQLCDNIRPFLSDRCWSVDAVSRLFRFRSLDQFLATFDFTGYFVRDASDLRMLISGVLKNLRAQNVVYAEITISPSGYLRQRISLGDIKACLEEAREFPGIRVQWIVDLIRDYGKDAALALLKNIINLRCETIVGITLGGSEHRFPPKQFTQVYSLAKDNGLRLTIHAGESVGPRSIWDAIRALGVERIGHGVRAIEDSSLVAYLADNDIPLEVCPTSNITTGIFPSYEAHPVKALFEAGVPVTINSDDPTFFGTTLTDEYHHVYTAALREDDMIQIIKNGFAYAFLPRKEIQTYLNRLEKEWAKLRPPRRTCT